MFAHRDIEVQERGVVKAEFSITVTGNGAKAMFFDSNKNTFLEIVHKNGSIVVLGDKEYDTGYKIKTGPLKFYLELDLDNEKIFVSINGTDVGTYSTKPIMNFARFSFGTQAENTASIGLGYVHMYTNYDVYDVFRYTPEGQKPYGWNVTGNAVITPVNSAYDIGGVKITDAGKITKKFSPVGDKFVYETFLLVPKGQPAYIALMNGNKEAVKVTATADGKFVCGNTTLREFDNRVWQLIRVEADTASNKAIIKINGKKFGTVDFNEDAIDEIVIAFEGKGEMLVDDVELYNVFDYADYCPVPVPVNEDEWYVGMSVCSLWREGTHFGWQYIDGYDDIEPLMGYYDEGIAEVADWEIKFLSEHGYDFMHYCWYVGNQGKEPIKNTRMGAALCDGYFNAKYSDMLDFSIMWENNNCNFTDSKYFYDVVWPYWCEWFFSDERYMRIDNKAVFTIYLYENFITHMGGEDKAKEVIAFMKEDIKRYGYDGMIILCMNTSNKPADAKKITELGVDARVAYHLGENGYKADYQIMRTEELFNMEAVTYLPSVGIGFNDIGWTQVRTPLATPEEHKRMLEWAKNIYMPKVAEKEEEEWYSKFVIANTWNEYGEGHYIMPSSLNEFGYVDANRDVFSSVAGKNDAKHFDVKPTDNQKDRLVNMHSGAHTSMKKQGYVEDKFDLNKAEKTYTFNFEDEINCLYWKGTNVKDFGYNSIEKALCGEATTNDVILTNSSVDGVEIDADRAKYLRIVMKYDGGDYVSGNLFFLNEGDKEFTGKKGFAFKSAVKKDEYFEIVIDLSDNEFWKGKINNLRFDPCNVLGGKFAVKSLEFISSVGPDDLNMDIDGYILAVPKNCITKKNGEIYVAGNPADGFYSLQNMYYEYNRKTGRFFLKTSTNTEFEFTVGSEKVKVNGETKSLNEKLELYEGLVKLPLCFVYDNSGIEYTWNENNMSVTVREKVPDNEENERKEYCWEFNKSGDFENWGLEMATGGVYGGKIYMQASPVATSKYGYDPAIKNTAVYMDASYYTSIDIRLKTEFTGDINGTEVSVYFTTNSDSKLNEAKSVKIDLAKLTTDADGFYNINASMKENANWKGYITTLRIDPTNNVGYYEFDYIRCVVDPEKEEILAALIAEKENDEVLLKAADEGAPFYIKNPDGQSITGTFNATSSNATVTLAQDPDNSENMAYLTVPTVKEKRSWTYFYVPTRFKPGVTYKVEYDVKVIGDQNGNAVTSASLVPNLRYTDYAKDGTLKVKMDHPIAKNAIKASTGDGWIHCSFEHTVSANSPERSNDFFAIYSEPQGTNEAPVNIAFMVDNIVVTSLGMAELGAT